MYRNKNYMLHAKAFLTSLSTRVWNIITYTCTVKVARCEGLIGLKKIWSSSAHFLTQTSNTCPENLYQTMHHLYRTGFHSFASFYEAERSATVSCSKRKLSYQNSNPPDSSKFFSCSYTTFGQTLAGNETFPFYQIMTCAKYGMYVGTCVIISNP